MPVPMVDEEPDVEVVRTPRPGVHLLRERNRPVARLSGGASAAGGA